MTRRLILSVVWAYAALVWGSIGHTLLGLPDIGPVVAPVLFAAIVLLPLARRGHGASRSEANVVTRTLVVPGSVNNG